MTTTTLKKAWEILPDGGAIPVTVLSTYTDMFGFWRVQRESGERVPVYQSNLRDEHDLDLRFAVRRTDRPAPPTAEAEHRTHNRYYPDPTCGLCFPEQDDE